jgi:hypothetical protein
MNQVTLAVQRLTVAQLIGYRGLVGLALLLILLLMLIVPHDQRRLRMPDPWTYEVAAGQFAQGHWRLNQEQMTAVMEEVEARGDKLILYVKVAPASWALRKAPGHPLEMVLAGFLGSTRLANMAWAILGAVVLYALLAACYSERIAFIGVTFFLCSPLNLLALHYYNMDSYAAGVAPLVAGGLLLWYEQKQPKSIQVPWLTGFFAGWMVVVRLTNGLLLPLLLFYFWQIMARQRMARQRPFNPKPLIALISGLLLPVALLALYNWFVFGRLFHSGYFYHSPYDQEFLWFARAADGMPAWLAGKTLIHILASLLANIRLWLQPTLLAWPLWPLALWGFIHTWRQPTTRRMAYFWGLWLLLVYVPYAGLIFDGATRALTNSFNQTWGFFSPTRYLFPLILPLICLLMAVLARQPRKVSLALTAVYALASLWLFFEALARSSLIAGLG